MFSGFVVGCLSPINSCNYTCTNLDAWFFSICLQEMLLYLVQCISLNKTQIHENIKWLICMSLFYIQSLSEWFYLLHVAYSILYAMLTLTIKPLITVNSVKKHSQKKSDSWFCAVKSAEESGLLNIILKHWNVWHFKEVRCTHNLRSALDHYHIESLFSFGWLQPPSLVVGRRPFIQLNTWQPALLLELNLCVMDFQRKKTVTDSSIPVTTFNEGKESYYCSHLLP